MEEAVDISQIDNEGEYLLRTLKESPSLLEHSDQLCQFVDRNMQICSHLVGRLEMKNCYYIYKKMEKVLT